MAKFQLKAFLKWLFLSFFFLLINYPASSQIKSDLIPYRNKSKWGYADKTGKMVIKPKYQETVFFEQYNYEGKPVNLAKTKRKNKTGLLDDHNKIAIPFDYDSVAITSRAIPYILVRNKNKWGLHQLYGKQVAACTLDYNNAFDKALNLNNEILIKSGKDDWGNPVQSNTENTTPKKFYDYHEHLKWVKKFATADGNFKVPGTSLNIHLPFEKDQHGGYYYWYQAGAIEALQNKKWGLMDTSGQILIPFNYDTMVCYNYASDMRLVVALNKKYGILSRNGKILLPIEFDKISDDVAFNLSNPYQTKTQKSRTETKNEGIGWVKKKQ